MKKITIIKTPKSRSQTSVVVTSAETAKIEEILSKIRPYIQMHGGDVHLASFKEGIVTLNISGACSHCHLADMTYNTMISGILKQEIPSVKEIRLNK
jgi:Fe-S cluster biogenesis protein NfuA